MSTLDRRAPGEALEGASEGGFSGKFSLTTYVLPDGLSYEEWAAEGRGLILMARASMWWVGDWIRYGENCYGERYSQAIEATGLAVQTLMNAVWVCKRIPPAERRDDLDFTHYTRIASLDPAARAEIAEQAATENWTVGRTAAEVKHVKEAQAAAADTSAVVAVVVAVVAPEPSLDPLGELGELLAQAASSLGHAIEEHDWKLARAAHESLGRAMVVRAQLDE